MKKLFKTWFPTPGATVKGVVITVVALVVIGIALRFTSPAFQVKARSFLGLAQA